MENGRKSNKQNQTKQNEVIKLKPKNNKKKKENTLMIKNRLIK